MLHSLQLAAHCDLAALAAAAMLGSLSFTEGVRTDILRTICALKRVKSQRRPKNQLAAYNTLAAFHFLVVDALFNPRCRAKVT